MTIQEICLIIKDRPITKQEILNYGLSINAINRYCKEIYGRKPYYFKCYKGYKLASNIDEFEIQSKRISGYLSGYIKPFKTHAIHVIKTTKKQEIISLANIIFGENNIKLLRQENEIIN